MCSYVVKINISNITVIYLDRAISRESFCKSLQILVNSIGGNGSSPIKQLTEFMSQDTEMNENLE